MFEFIDPSRMISKRDLMPCHNHFGVHSLTHLNDSSLDGRRFALLRSRLHRQSVLLRGHLAHGPFQPGDLHRVFVTL